MASPQRVERPSTSVQEGQPSAAALTQHVKARQTMASILSHRRTFSLASRKRPITSTSATTANNRDSVATTTGTIDEKRLSVMEPSRDSRAFSEADVDALRDNNAFISDRDEDDHDALLFDPLGLDLARRNDGQEPRFCVTTQNFFMLGRVNVFMTGFRHGTIGGRDACLLLFEIQFMDSRFTEGLGFRFRRADVTLSFTNANNVASADGKCGTATQPVVRKTREPIVRRFSPQIRLGKATTEEKGYTYDTGVQVGAPGSPAGADLKLEVQGKYAQEYRLGIFGATDVDRAHDEPNKVVFTVKENRRTKTGIPSKIHVGVVVERTADLQATLEVGVNRRPVMSWLSRFRDDPLLLPATTGDERGPSIGNPDFDLPDWRHQVDGNQRRPRVAPSFGQLRDSDWRKLVPYIDTEGKVDEKSQPAHTATVPQTPVLANLGST